MKGRTCPKEVMFTCSIVKTFHVLFFSFLRKKSCEVLAYFLLLFIILNSTESLLDLIEAWVSRFQQKETSVSQLYVHRRHALVEDLRPHQLDAGHDLLLVAHQRHPEPLDVPAGCTHQHNKSINKEF